MNKKSRALIAYVVAALLVGVAVVYFTVPANQLPAVMPGYDASIAKVHTKHGLAALFLAIGCVAYAWFQKGPKSQAHDSSPEE